MGRFDAFKKNLSKAEVEKLENDYKSGGARTEVPSGTYVVALRKLEASTKHGNYGDFSNINIDFEVIEGEHKKQHIFYNGTFNNKIDSGYRATARLLSEMTDKEVSEAEILSEISEGIDSCKEYITDLYQALAGAFEYSLNLQIQEQTDINPATNKPYKPNRFFSIEEVYDA